MVVHCWAGISRSTAAAFTSLCAINPDAPEELIAQRLREASLTAYPNRLMVRLADDALGRHGRMVHAVERMGRGRRPSGDPVLAQRRRCGGYVPLKCLITTSEWLPALGLADCEKLPLSGLSPNALILTRLFRGDSWKRRATKRVRSDRSCKCGHILRGGGRGSNRSECRGSRVCRVTSRWWPSCRSRQPERDGWHSTLRPVLAARARQSGGGRCAAWCNAKPASSSALPQQLCTLGERAQRSGMRRRRCRLRVLPGAGRAGTCNEPQRRVWRSWYAYFPWEDWRRGKPAA